MKRGQPAEVRIRDAVSKGNSKAQAPAGNQLDLFWRGWSPGSWGSEGSGGHMILNLSGHDQV